MNPGDAPAWGVDWAWGLHLVPADCCFSPTASAESSRMFPANWMVSTPSGISRPARSLWLEERLFQPPFCTVSKEPSGRSLTVFWVLRRIISLRLYSLEAMTSYGHENLFLASHWRMLGAPEALTGWILFGLTTAFLFAVIQRAWPYKDAERPPRS
jgi:hypothetical protein